jgi:hypothetical protein
LWRSGQSAKVKIFCVGNRTIHIRVKVSEAHFYVLVDVLRDLGTPRARCCEQELAHLLRSRGRRGRSECRVDRVINRTNAPRERHGSPRERCAPRTSVFSAKLPSSSNERNCMTISLFCGVTRSVFSVFSGVNVTAGNMPEFDVIRGAFSFQCPVKSRKRGAFARVRCGRFSHASPG